MILRLAHAYKSLNVTPPVYTDRQVARASLNIHALVCVVQVYSLGHNTNDFYFYFYFSDPPFFFDLHNLSQLFTTLSPSHL
jgi:hypothetical protein